MFRNVIFVFCKTFENSVNNKKLVIFHENCSKTFSRSLKRHNVKFLKTRMVQLILDTKTFIIIEKPPHKKTHFECCVLKKTCNNSSKTTTNKNLVYENLQLLICRPRYSLCDM